MAGETENKQDKATAVDRVVHTPGPWRQFAPEIDGQVCQDYRTIRGGMGLRGEGFELTGFVSEADARLIAAAPELLEACRLVLESIWQTDIGGAVLWINRGSGVHESASERLMDVIEKATGEVV
jgi:hypothetical protein